MHRSTITFFLFCTLIVLGTINNADAGKPSKQQKRTQKQKRTQSIPHPAILRSCQEHGLFMSSFFDDAGVKRIDDETLRNGVRLSKKYRMRIVDIRIEFPENEQARQVKKVNEEYTKLYHELYSDLTDEQIEILYKGFYTLGNVMVFRDEGTFHHLKMTKNQVRKIEKLWSDVIHDWIKDEKAAEKQAEKVGLKKLLAKLKPLQAKGEDVYEKELIQQMNSAQRKAYFQLLDSRGLARIIEDHNRIGKKIRQILTKKQLETAEKYGAIFTYYRRN